MSWRKTSALLLVLLASNGSAQTPEQVDEFNNAWRAYKDAVESHQTDAVMQKARDVLDIGKRIFPENDDRIAVLTQNYGSALLAGERFDEAQEQLGIALELFEARHGEDSIELVLMLGELADANSGFGNEHKQLKFYKRALRITAGEHGDTSKEYADLAFRAARNVYEQSHSQIGKKYLEAAQEIFLAEYGAADPRVGLTNFYLGKMRFSKMQYKQAAKYLEASLPAFEGDSDGMKSLRLVTRALLVRSYESRGKSDLATPHCVAIGQESQISPNQDYTPIFRLAPAYPGEALARGVEGFVDLAFTIDENGFVQDPQIIQSEPGRSYFEQEAMDVVKKFRYAPRFEDGEAVAVNGVKTRISFQLVH